MDAKLSSGIDFCCNGTSMKPSQPELIYVKMGKLTNYAGRGNFVGLYCINSTLVTFTASVHLVS